MFQNIDYYCNFIIFIIIIIIVITFRHDECTHGKNNSLYNANHMNDDNISDIYSDDNTGKSRVNINCSDKSLVSVIRGKC